MHVADQHPPPAHHAGLARRYQGDLEDPVRPRRPGQPGPHIIHQHRMHEPRIAEVQPPGRTPPPRIEREPVHRLPVTAPPDPLQQG